MRTVGKYGLRLPPPGIKWAFKFSSYVDASQLPPIPTGAFGHMDLVSDWGMMLNDRLGCCLVAGAQHEHMLWGAESGHGTPQFNDDNTVANYELLGGYRPDDPNTDQGCDMVNASRLRMTEGIIDAKGQRHHVGIALELDCGPGYLNMEQFWYAAWLFDGLGLGIMVTPQWEQDFAAGKPWDSTDYNPDDIAGGHYVSCMAREGAPGQFEADVVTWGEKQPITTSGLRACTSQVMCYASREKLRDGKDMNGLSWSDMRADIRKITQ